MNDRSYLENHLLLVIYATGIIFFIVRIVAHLDGNWDSMIQDPDWVSNTDRLQFLMGMFITVVFIMSVIPRWVNKLKITKLNTIVQYGCVIATMAIIFTMIPEITGKPIEFSDMKIIGMIVMLAVMVVFYIIAYIYGQKHKKDDKGGKDNEDDDRGSESSDKEN